MKIKHAMILLLSCGGLLQAEIDKTEIRALPNRIELSALKCLGVTATGRRNESFLVNRVDGYPTLQPKYNLRGYLGSPGKSFWQLHTRVVIIQSDERVKEEIQDLNPGVLEKFKKVRTVSYRLKSDVGRKGNVPEIGFLAQNLEETFPELVDHDEATDVYSVHYHRAVPLVLAGVLEQQKALDVQARKIAALQRKVGL